LAKANVTSLAAAERVTVVEDSMKAIKPVDSSKVDNAVIATLQKAKEMTEKKGSTK
jgi:hypothetical protein